jgi:chromosome segregation ATPase
MDDEPPKDLATRAFQKRVLDEFAAVRREQAAFREELSAFRAEQAAMHAEQDAIRAEHAEIQEQPQRFLERVDLMLQDLFEVRADVRTHDKRIGELERRVTS